MSCPPHKATHIPNEIPVGSELVAVYAGQRTLVVVENTSVVVSSLINIEIVVDTIVERGGPGLQ